MLYFAQNPDNYQIKIGYTEKDVADERLRSGKTWIPGLVLLAIRDGDKAADVEIREQFSRFRVHERNDSEWFYPAPELLLFIIGTAAISCAKIAITQAADLISNQIPPELESERESRCESQASIALEDLQRNGWKVWVLDGMIQFTKSSPNARPATKQEAFQVVKEHYERVKRLILCQGNLDGPEHMKWQK